MCRNLGFDEKPKYDYLRSQFYNLLDARGEKVDPYTDWILKKLDRKIPEKAYIQSGDKPSKSNKFNSSFSREM